jgi:hypothetical protein
MVETAATKNLRVATMIAIAAGINCYESSLGEREKEEIPDRERSYT